MTGPLTCPLQNGLRMTAKPTNEVVCVIGMAYATLNDKFQIQDLEVYFDQNEPMSSMVRINAPAAYLRKPDSEQEGEGKAPKHGNRQGKATEKALSEAASRTPSQAEMSKLDIKADARQGTPREQAQASRSIWGTILNLLSPSDD